MRTRVEPTFSESPTYRAAELRRERWQAEISRLALASIRDDERRARPIVGRRLYVKSS